MSADGKPVKGRGAAVQPANRFLGRSHGFVEWEGIDDPLEESGPTRFIAVEARSIVNTVNSPDLPFTRTINPYQGCEHGCAYCYARPTHEYWGYSAGLDFEQVILVKQGAGKLFRQTMGKPGWVPEPVMIAGATDPCQPVERKARIT
ncbi:MAG: radical SAM protein, partial [Flavobacteriales bacterium]